MLSCAISTLQKHLWVRQARRWACDACSNPYDLGDMEARLVSIVQGRARSYQLQDLKCIKCRKVGSPPQDAETPPTAAHKEYDVCAAVTAVPAL